MSDTDIVPPEVVGRLALEKPTVETTNVTAPEGALIENVPLASVATPFDLPLIITEAPGWASFVSDVTFPVMVLVCACTIHASKRKQDKIIDLFSVGI